jgi:hypothetical protein
MVEIVCGERVEGDVDVWVKKDVGSFRKSQLSV